MNSTVALNSDVTLKDQVVPDNIGLIDIFVACDNDFDGDIYITVFRVFM